MNLTYFRREGRVYVARSFAEGRIVVVDFLAQKVILEFAPKFAAAQHIYASPDGSLLAACNWYSKGIEVFDSISGEPREFLRHSQPLAVWFDRTNRYLVVYANRKNGLIQRKPATFTAIRGIRDMYSPALHPLRNELWMPTRGLGRVIVVRHSPFEVETLKVPSREEVWHLRFSPNATCFVYSSGKADGSTDIVMMDAATFEVRWKRTIEASLGASIVSLTADGRFVVVYLHNRSYSAVLDSESGKDVGCTPVGAIAKFPIGPTRFLGSRGMIIDVETGFFDNSLTQAEWWRRAGVKQLRS